MLNDDYRIKHREIWSLDGKSFAVEVGHWKMPLIGNIWNIYVVFWSDFPQFNDMQDDFNGMIAPIEFHGGVTFHQFTYDSYAYCLSKKYGCDYNHAWDSRFTAASTKEEAIEVFTDANNIFETLLQYTNQLVIEEKNEFKEVE
jgi:hypothetical protein